LNIILVTSSAILTIIIGMLLAPSPVASVDLLYVLLVILPTVRLFLFPMLSIILLRIDAHTRDANVIRYLNLRYIPVLARYQFYATLTANYHLDLLIGQRVGIDEAIPQEVYSPSPLNNLFMRPTLHI